MIRDFTPKVEFFCRTGLVPSNAESGGSLERAAMLLDLGLPVSHGETHGWEA